ncbi:hypothetical protein EIP86_005049 [Pleurotus ostreatoroseus]|nr:hypothetical protein EIP86_005049 [Pleurotus ostreatoroseus]
MGRPIARLGLKLIGQNKPNGQYMLQFEPAAVKAFMYDLPIRKIPGVGRVNERLLDSIGIETCGDIYTHRATVSLMDKHFGLHFLLQTYLGIASNIVQPGQREERKSIGSERTFHPIGDKEKILAKLEEVCAELEEDMERTGWTGKTTGKELLLPELPLRVRLIGMRVTKLKDLREDIDSKPGSIKRFFEKTAGPSSPSKKRPASEGDEEQPTRLTQDGYEDAMPGYHEEEDDGQINDVDSALRNEDDTQSGAGVEQDTNIVDPSSRQANKEPTSAPSANSKPFSSAKPSSSAKRSRSGSVMDGSHEMTCPICSKTLQTDNRGLNEHIDFCLSKGAIREAQAMASRQKSPINVSSSSRSTANVKRRKTQHKGS